MDGQKRRLSSQQNPYIETDKRVDPRSNIYSNTLSHDKGYQSLAPTAFPSFKNAFKSPTDGVTHSFKSEEITAPYCALTTNSSSPFKLFPMKRQPFSTNPRSQSHIASQDESKIPAHVRIIRLPEVS